MAAKLTRLTHKVAIQLHLVVESCTICSSRSTRPARKLLHTPSYYVVIPCHWHWTLWVRRPVSHYTRNVSHWKPGPCGSNLFDMWEDQWKKLLQSSLNSQKTLSGFSTLKIVCYHGRVLIIKKYHVLFSVKLMAIYEGVSNIFRTGLERELQMVQLSAIRCSCIAILWVSLVSFAWHFV
jgi:hypothetical protein